MIEKVNNRSPGMVGTAITGVVMAVLCLTAFAGAANAATAGTAANAVVRNKVTVTYQDSKNTPMPTLYAAVDVTINTVNVAPTVYAFSPASGNTDGAGATQAYQVTVITNSNGPGTIALTGATDNAVSVPVNNMSALGSAAAFVANSNTYGATTVNPGDSHIGSALVVASGANITFNVPYDSTQADGAGTINSLAAGNTVYVYDGTTYYGPFTIAAAGVTNGVRNGTPTGTGSTTNVSTPTNGTITLTAGAAINSGATSVVAGWQIVQARTFAAAVTVTQGTIANPAATAFWTTTVSAAMTGQTGTATVTTNAKQGQLVIYKYVRNISTVGNNTGAIAYTTAAGAAAPLVSQNFYSTGGVKAAPNETLEYLIVVQNAGLGAVNAVVATDNVPTYTTLVEGSAYGVSGGGTVFALAERYNGTAWTSTVNTLVQAGGATANVAYGKTVGPAAGDLMTFNIGQGSGAGSGGGLNAGDIVYIILQTKVN